MKTLIFSIVVFALGTGVLCTEDCGLQDSLCADCLTAQKSPDLWPHFDANPPDHPLPMDFSEVIEYSVVARIVRNYPFEYRNSRPHTGRSILISKSSWLK